MARDEAEFNDQATERHVTPIIQQVSQLNIAQGGAVKMPHVRTGASPCFLSSNCDLPAGACCLRMPVFALKLRALVLTPSLKGPQRVTEPCCLQSLSTDEIDLAGRPEKPGSQGKVVKLATNFFKANFSQVPPIMHHDVRVERLRYNPETGVILRSPC